MLNGKGDDERAETFSVEKDVGIWVALLDEGGEGSEISQPISGVGNITAIFWARIVSLASHFVGIDRSARGGKGGAEIGKVGGRAIQPVNADQHCAGF